MGDVEPLSSWSGALAAGTSACSFLRGRGVSCGCGSVFLHIASHHGGAAPVVSLVGYILRGRQVPSVSQLCAVQSGCAFSVHHLAP